jgi:hypothetical protein
VKERLYPDAKVISHADGTPYETADTAPTPPKKTRKPAAPRKPRKSTKPVADPVPAEETTGDGAE